MTEMASLHSFRDTKANWFLRFMAPSCGLQLLWLTCGNNYYQLASKTKLATRVEIKTSRFVCLGSDANTHFVVIGNGFCNVFECAS